MARAHRLGQTNKVLNILFWSVLHLLQLITVFTWVLGLMSQVMIYRLVTRGTIEERMLQMTKKKMVLEHLVVGRLKAQNINQVYKFSNMCSFIF